MMALWWAFCDRSITKITVVQQLCKRLFATNLGIFLMDRIYEQISLQVWKQSNWSYVSQINLKILRGPYWRVILIKLYQHDNISKKILFVYHDYKHASILFIERVQSYDDFKTWEACNLMSFMCLPCKK